MSYRTVEAASFEEYLASDDDSVEDRASQKIERNERLLRFPFSVMLKVSFPELDFANRWCWQNFGPGDGECTQSYSRYRVCDRKDRHTHEGRWASHWFVKTDYDFGFNEWYFVASRDHELFVANIANINWGENFLK
ncbi:hypothetical protein [Anatilimnocola floriformis]|uniref:hypothetical protein n=1 Tax=Anatilimnocola floriformis TaxID=2948575 RepID=UPI0020C2E3D4|nr:hypothetical protein [Anatilimnocola floriformis]